MLFIICQKQSDGKPAAFAPALEFISIEIKMKIILLLIIKLTLCNFCFGQSIDLKGEIKDLKTGEPLPYATVEIYNLKTGTITDKNGIFQFEVTPNNLISDTINFSFVGYETTKMAINDFLKSEKEIKLKGKTIELGEVRVIPKKYSITTVGIRDKSPTSKQYSNIFGTNKGNFIGNKKMKIGWFKSISYYIHQDGFPTSPFRVRIYQVGEHNKPGKDLLNENLVVSAPKAGWIKIDISDYNIPFPKEGAFVTMEWINSGKEFYFEKESIVKDKNGQAKTIQGKYYGQSLGVVSKKGGVVLWGSNLGNEWIPYDFNYKGKYPNAMINAEIVYEKD